MSDEDHHRFLPCQTDSELDESPSPLDGGALARADLLPPWKIKRAYLGISLGRLYYSSARLNAYCAWAVANAPRGFAFLIGDDIYALTLRVFARLSAATALCRARAKGDDIQRQLERIAAARGLTVTILRWSDLYTHELYSQLLTATLTLRDEDVAFKMQLREQASVNLRRRFVELDNISSRRASQNWEHLEAYIMHEIAGLITMSEQCSFPVEVYPGHDLKIVADIYRGVWPELRNLLPNCPQREFYRLEVN